MNWGDGTYLSGSSVVIEKDGTASTLHRFKIVGAHTYHTPGQYPVTVNVADPGGAQLTLNGTANISASPLALSGTEIYKAGGELKNQVLATFVDHGAAATAASYTATVDWGDGNVSPGTVKVKGKGYEVLGTHTYTQPETFTIATLVARTGTYSATSWAGAHISGVDNAPAVLPPFAQGHLAQMWAAISEDQDTIVQTGTNNPGGNVFGGFVTGTDGHLYGAAANSGGINGTSGSIFADDFCRAAAVTRAGLPLPGTTARRPACAAHPGDRMAISMASRRAAAAAGAGTLFQLVAHHERRHDLPA